MEDLNADTVVEFLNYLEKVRKNQGKTINNRLATIKAFMDYVSYQFPEYLELVRRVKVIPFRNIDKKDISYLTKEEMDYLLSACNIKNPEGKRDYLLSGRNVNHLTRSGVRYRIDCIVKVASEKNSQLKTKNITPHVFEYSDDLEPHNLIRRAT